MVTHDRSEVLDAMVYTAVKAGYFKGKGEIQKALEKHGLSDAVEQSIERLRESGCIDADKNGNNLR